MAKHIPYTSEPSYPHKGKFGKMHIEVYHYGESGRKVGQTKHVTDEGHLDWGRDKEKLDRSRKRK